MNESLKLTLCEMQAQLFAQSWENGYASEVFIKAFMNSDIAEDLDMPSTTSNGWHQAISCPAWRKAMPML